MIQSWEVKPSGFDGLNIMQHRPEEGGAHGGNQVIHPFQDIILPWGIQPENLIFKRLASSSTTAGNIFSQELCKLGPRKLGIIFQGNLPVRSEGRVRQIRLVKEYEIPTTGKGFSLSVSLSTNEPGIVQGIYGLRFPIGCCPQKQTEIDSDRYGCTDASDFFAGDCRIAFPEVGIQGIDGRSLGELSGITKITWISRTGEEFFISLSKPISVWYHPCETDVLVEGQPVSIFQGIIITLLLPIRLSPKEGVTLKLRYRATNSKEKND